MPLIKCPDCGKDVSTMAQACPHCGRPVAEDKTPKTGPGKRIACPDGNCTGVIKETGLCGTCGKLSGWKDEPEKKVPRNDYTKTVAYQAGKAWATNKPGMIFLMISIVTLILVAWPKPKQSGSASVAQNMDIAPIVIDKKQMAMSLVSLDDLRWRKEGFGNVMEADFTIKNRSDQDIKDVKITCSHSAKSGTQIDKNTKTVYEVIKKHDFERIKNFNMGFIHSQAYSTSCEITDLAIFP